VKVLVATQLAEPGLSWLRERPDLEVEVLPSAPRAAFLRALADAEAVIVRSQPRVDAEALEHAPRLRVIGRGGMGVDNIDLERATQRGVLVVNAPRDNIDSAAEHTFALLLAVARRIPAFDRGLREGRWEKEALGRELIGKTIGVVGLGKVGQRVARMAQGFGMNVLAFDPFVSPEQFRQAGARRADAVEDLLREADVMTLHVPRPHSGGVLLDRARIALLKPGAIVVNTSRGGLVDEAALEEALSSGRLWGAGLDVWAEEPSAGTSLQRLPNVVGTPHLGASTEEAQDRAGVVVAEQVAAALTGGVVTSAVNIPAVGPEALEVLGPFLPLARQLGQLITAITGGPSPLEIVYEGDLANLDTRILTSAVLEGVLRGRVEEPVNVVNATSLADERGIEWIETSTPRARDYTNRLTLRAGEVSLGGTTVGTTSRPRLVEAFGRDIDIELAPHIGIFRYLDIPGQIGRVGTILGLANVNIASMAVARSRSEGGAVMAVTVDSPVSAEVLREIVAVDGFDEVWFAALDVE
jgi:D-3-phosphoglycerate dehydrogenase